MGAEIRFGGLRFDLELRFDGSWDLIWELRFDLGAEIWFGAEIRFGSWSRLHGGGDFGVVFRSAGGLHFEDSRSGFLLPAQPALPALILFVACGRFRSRADRRFTAKVGAVGVGWSSWRGGAGRRFDSEAAGRTDFGFGFGIVLIFDLGAAAQRFAAINSAVGVGWRSDRRFTANVGAVGVGWRSGRRFTAVGVDFRRSTIHCQRWRRWCRMQEVDDSRPTYVGVGWRSWF